MTQKNSSHAARFKASDLSASRTLADALPAPVCPDAAAGLLDPNELSDLGVGFVVKAYPNMGEGDHVIFQFDMGGPGEYTKDFDVSRKKVGTDISFTVPKANVVKALDNDVTAAYLVEPGDGGPEIPSAPLPLHIGNPPLLAAPSVDEAVDGHLDGSLATSDVLVRIPIYKGMAAGDKVYMYWGAAGEAGYYEDEITLRAVRSVTFLVEAEYVGPYLDKTVHVRYDVNRGGAISPSALYALRIGNAPDESKLPAPVVAEAIGDILNPDLVPDGCTGLLGPNEGLGNGVKGKAVWGGGPPDGIEIPFDISENFQTEPYPVHIPYANITPFLNKSVTFQYSVLQTDNATWLQSNVLTLQVEQQVAQVAPPSVPEAANGVLDPRALSPQIGCPVFVPAAEHTRQGDTIRLTWASEKTPGNWDGEHLLLSTEMDQSIEFDVPYTNVMASLDAQVTVSYSLWRAGKRYASSLPLTLTVQQGNLPAATIDQATGSTLDPADCPDGATVRLDRSGGFRAGDQITLQWQGVPGPGSVTANHTVSDAEQGGDVTLNVSQATVQADVGQTVTLEYTVIRAGNPTEEKSPPSLYDVTAQPGQGKLLVMGARNSSAGFRWEHVSHRLSAFDKATSQPLNAQWRYDDESNWKLGASFKDTRPWVPLNVKSQDDTVTIQPVNIAGTGDNGTTRGTAAMVALLNKGGVIGWGVASYGGTVPPTILTYDDVVEMAATQAAFAVRRSNGRIAAWGNADYGGTLPDGFTVSVTDATRIVGSYGAFAVLRANGQIATWGNATFGGQATADVLALTDVTQIFSGSSALAALRKTGQIVAWGDTRYGGKVPESISSEVTDIIDVRGNYESFCALRANKTVVAWGTAGNGGAVPATIAARRDIVELAAASAYAYAVVTDGKQVLVWGHADWGGVLPPDIAELTDIEEVIASKGAFAARRANGRVVAWGSSSWGSVVPADIALIPDIVQVAASDGAFAALRRDGTVVTWGNAAYGGDSSAVKAQLQNVRAIYGNSEAFVAILAGGGAVTWGTAAGGGNSASVKPYLDSGLTYEAGAAARGRARAALRVRA
ncbi:RCC1 domain-containing protein [Pandoraea pulmonicola]|uniref:Uncharacterized protein n=1 Tax=Pandoraea pulmonicola TaxID=93221 RepID=A0AAJ4ZHK8_PANPU|nr:hypothetical protein [Pandoraea pulmonicola]APD13482.1 hypothetical protein RO07_21000 [Pandoraea pulmonicola]SUD95578.1 Uncharacterised protein [Pandoraea pulmonicola]